MDWVDRLNHWALKSIRRGSVESVASDPEGAVLTSATGRQFIRWCDICEIAVVKQPTLAQGAFALAIQGKGSSTLVLIDDTAAGYASFCEELSRRLNGVVPYQQWAVELTANSQKNGTVIFRRT